MVSSVVLKVMLNVFGLLIQESQPEPLTEAVAVSLTTEQRQLSEELGAALFRQEPLNAMVSDLEWLVAQSE